MSKPATHRDLLDVIRLSRLVDEPRLAAALARHPAAPDLLARLVAEDLLTPFQAGQLRLGRWRGFLLGGYRLREKIGQGGMGQVFLADRADRGGAFAVKVLSGRLADDRVARARFLREAEVAAALDHPNVVRVIDFDLDCDPPYLVMDYIAGPSLQAAVARFGTLSAGFAAHCGRHVALGLAGAHELGLVHRDVKPANVLLDALGRVKILDFGIVRLGDDLGLTTALDRRSILGTADYLAPEQARDSHAVDIRADLYALGGTLHFLLTGRPPFDAGAAPEKLALKQQRDPDPVERSRPDLDPALAALVNQLLARDSARRPADPARVARDLARFAAPDAEYLAKVFAAGQATASDDSTTPTPGGVPMPTARVIAGSGTWAASAERTAVVPAPVAGLTEAADPFAELAPLDFAPPASAPAPSALRVAAWLGAAGLLAALLLLAGAAAGFLAARLS